ncbi:endonuclease MutS2, partial [Turicibacter sanguinis]|nr:endonuclease MutS2 [Turicibacter sanguinis]
LVEEMKKEYEQKLAKFEAEREKVLEDIKKEAFESVRQAKEEAEQIVMDLRQAKKMADLSMKDHELTEKLTSLKKAEAKQAEQFKKKAQNKQPLKPGDEVMVLSLNRQGELIEQTKNGEWMVQLGMMKVNIKPEDLQYLRKSVQKKETKKGQMVHKRNSHVGIQLDLRGERYEDAMLMLDKYFDDVLLAGYQTITIIHGHGTGALRQGVHKYLKQNKHVASFRFGGAGEGGTGATVVELK